MNREEFSNMLVRARKEAGVTLKDLMFKYRIHPSESSRIERGKSACSMVTYFKYLRAIGYAIRISGHYAYRDISAYDELVEWVVSARGKTSKAAFSRMVGISSVYIASIERKGNVMSIDKFLKIAEVTGYEIRLVKKEEQ